MYKYGKTVILVFQVYSATALTAATTFLITSFCPANAIQFSGYCGASTASTTLFIWRSNGTVQNLNACPKYGYMIGSVVMKIA